MKQASSERHSELSSPGNVNDVTNEGKRLKSWSSVATHFNCPGPQGNSSALFNILNDVVAVYGKISRTIKKTLLLSCDLL